MKISEEILYHLSINVKTELKASDLDGIGVFAIRDIAEGEELFPVWEGVTGAYVLTKEDLSKLPIEVYNMIDKYFITPDSDFTIIRLFNGLNFLNHSFCYCNSAWPNQENQNISNNGIALKDIKAGEEILEWYTENINLAKSK